MITETVEVEIVNAELLRLRKLEAAAISKRFNDVLGFMQGFFTVQSAYGNSADRDKATSRLKAISEFIEVLESPQ